MSNYKNPFSKGGKFYNPRITNASRVTEPRIMPRWAEQKQISGTDVRKNSDGSYTVVNAYYNGSNNEDNDIYVVNANGDRTGETIEKTLTPFDFMSTYDATGGFHFDPYEGGSVTFRLDNLVLQGMSYKEIGITEITETTGEILVLDMNNYFLTNGKLVNLATLAALSRNEAVLDVKHYLGAYTPILYKTGSGGTKYITTIRAVGNIAFGLNMRSTSLSFPLLNKIAYYKMAMKVVGAYNQHQNNGNGYNPD